MRQPAAIGFYPQDRFELEDMAKKLTVTDKHINAIGAVCPHAGYTYSGQTAGKTLATAKTDKTTFLILCPNHTGQGKEIAVSRQDWQTPIGTVQTDKKLIENLSLSIDESAHKNEHSIEVQLPLLQAIYKDFKIVPVCIGQIDLDQIKELAKKLVNKNSFYIASSDFIHFGPMYGYVPFNAESKKQLEWVRQQDMKMIDLITKLKPKKFYNKVMENNYTVCGAIPITVLLYIMKSLGAKQGHPIDYKSSYAVQPSSSFVSYAGIVFSL